MNGEGAAPLNGATTQTQGQVQDDSTWIAESLEIARELIRAGVPIRPAKRARRKTDRGWEWDATGGTDGLGYWLPQGWQETEASEAWLDHWRKGDALMLITGVTADGFDCDPRHKGDESVAQLRAEGKMPKGTGRQETPSGGWHTLISPLGLGSDNGARPGVDIKSGNGTEGRGFLFLAPTVKVSKTTGKHGRYRWTERPDVASLNGDGSGAALAEEIRQRREHERKTGPATGTWLTNDTPSPRVQAKLDQYHAEVIAKRARHDSMRDTIMDLVIYGFAGDPGVRQAREELRQAFLIDLTDEPGRDAESEFESAERGAVAKVAARTGTALTVIEQRGPLFVTGEEFLRLAQETTIAAWGDGDVCLWMPGESLMLVGPPGVGKSTLAHLIIWARLGMLDSVLGWTVLPSTAKVLYLAMDRPQQIARAMARLVDDEHWPILREHLIVRPGPLPVDLCESPAWALDQAQEHGADLIVADSLKDVIPDPSDEKRAGQYHGARNLALAEGVQWIELHHNRKAGVGNKEPNTLDDVYGSRFLTAGAGSVLSLFGEAGDTVVSLKQLKAPAGEFFPRWVLLDKDRGRMSLHETVTVEALVERATGGTSAAMIARKVYETEKPSRSQVQAVRNKLKRLVDQGKAEEYVSPVDKGQMFRATRSNGSNIRATAATPDKTDTATPATPKTKAQVRGSNANSNDSNAPSNVSGLSIKSPDVAGRGEEPSTRLICPRCGGSTTRVIEGMHPRLWCADRDDCGWKESAA